MLYGRPATDGDWNLQNTSYQSMQCRSGGLTAPGSGRIPSAASLRRQDGGQRFPQHMPRKTADDEADRVARYEEAGQWSTAGRAATMTHSSFGLVPALPIT